MIGGDLSDRLGYSGYGLRPLVQLQDCKGGQYVRYSTWEMVDLERGKMDRMNHSGICPDTILTFWHDRLKD
ncbi:hypothetical protein [Asticcacaulis benevestitus]|uniref:hypothetical protein n=1 Tax=Asticcacaulis benevestitus TaxID=347481 RepID=UPI000AD98509|nr:hypothetical protein [Asticcacaulis benevestitus]